MPRYHHICTDGNLPHKHESCLPSCTGPDPRNAHARISYQPDAPHLPLLADTEDTGLSHDEHVVLCCVTWSLLFFHERSIPYKLFSVPGRSRFNPGFLCMQLRQLAQNTQSYQRPRPKNKSRHRHHERRPLRCFPRKSTQSNLQDIRANLHETTEHGLPTHVRLVHHEVR
jgi:hypothetical protein